MTLGQTLYNLRTKANMTQEQLAEKMHVSRQSISKWESDAARPDFQPAGTDCRNTRSCSYLLSLYRYG